MTLLAPYVGNESVKDLKISSLGLFWFPETVNTHSVRLTSAMSCIFAILCIGFYDHPVAKWAVLYLAVD